MPRNVGESFEIGKFVLLHNGQRGAHDIPLIAFKKVNQIQPTYGLCNMIDAVGESIAENKNTTRFSGKG